MERRKELGSNDLLMKANRRIGNKKIVVVISILVFIIFFLLGNFIINVISNSLQKDFNNMFTLSNVFKIDFDYISQSGVIKFFYVVLLVGDILYTAVLAYRIRTSYADLNIGQKGTSRFTTPEEIKEQYKEVPIKDAEFPGYGGIPVATIGNKMYIDDTNTNTTCLGITRSGKGEMYVVPCIDLYSRGKEKASMLILDMKMELICRSYQALVDRGYDVEFLNIQDPSMGIQYNPLYLIVKYYISGDKSDAELLCNSFAYSIYSSNSSKGSGDNTEFFLDNATSALSSLIIAHIEDCNEQDMRENAAAEITFLSKQISFSNLSDEKKEAAKEYWNEHKPDIYTNEKLEEFEFIPDNEKYVETHENLLKVTVPSIVNTFTELAREWVDQRNTKLDIYFQKRPARDRSKAIYSSIELSGGGKTKGSIFSQALTKLNIYMYENITKLTARSTFDLEDLGFGERPVALFIGVPFHDRSKDSIVSTLISQVFQANARRALIEPGQKCKRKIVYQLDEVGNYPAIKDFKSMISVGLGCNMIFNLFLQTFSQLDSTYGEDDAKTIKGNCGNLVFIQTSQLDTAQEFSKLLGNETITNLTRTGKKMELTKSFTELNEERPLLNETELMQLRPGENVIKRVMKRTDLKGNKVVPYPIFNSIDRGTESRFSYEYLTDSFPVNVELNDLPLPWVDTENPEYYNFNISMNKYAFEYMDEIIKSGNEEEIEQISTEEMEEYDAFKEYYKYDALVIDKPNCKQLLDIAAQRGFDVNKNIKVGDFIGKIINSDMELNEKQAMINLLR